MKVGELIKKLSDENENLEVFIKINGQLVDLVDVQTDWDGPDQDARWDFVTITHCKE